MDKYQEAPSCTCETCVNMCKRAPCWPTPEEAQRLIDAGYSPRLMKNYWCAEDNIYVLCPARVGYEGRTAPWFGEIDGSERCVFLTGDNLCELHDLGLKPIEGRVATCQGKGPEGCLREDIAKLWNTPKGWEVLRKWENDR